MPPESEAQRRFMRWAQAHPKASGVPKSVSRDFNEADKGGALPARKSDDEKARKLYDKKDT